MRSPETGTLPSGKVIVAEMVMTPAALTLEMVRVISSPVEAWVTVRYSPWTVSSRPVPRGPAVLL
ncbi:MAG: hypothetical protein A3E78_08495 [Alphaproteobacteria bacterium RIFCSPHIGHO2_12_FULL_63_12]|nr:MAG: hypothetical protein A3E78_08495 [Alphaproteobacteria bacterium RIFCSPHIGHO2_12_FULL_63_12]